MKNKVISEFGFISLSVSYETEIDSLNEVFVSEKTFINLKNLAFDSSCEGVFFYFIKRGKEQIQVKNYVGLLETNDGCRIEILPKIITNSHDLESCHAYQNDCRKALLKMLKTLQNSPFKSLQNSHLRATNLPILEIFISLFLDEIEQLFSQGLGHNYTEITGNENYLKGKLLLTENLKNNLIHQELFFIKYDVFLADIPQNRLLKSCLKFLSERSNNTQNKTRIKELLFVLDDINYSDNYYQDFNKTSANNRLFARYATALNWAKIFLQNKSFSPFSGTHVNVALLFPMEKLFENYVAYGFKKYLSDDYEVSLQESSNYLIINHLESPKFKLRPDIVVKKEEKILIFDTKWKLLETTSSRKNYGIEQADLYQLYAYGKKYKASELFLIYPKNENFQVPLQTFHYDSSMQLTVIPFDVLGNFECEINNIFCHEFR